jgi:hypothetical protein
VPDSKLPLANTPGVITVKTAEELVAIPKSLVTMTSYIPASEFCAAGMVKLFEFVPTLTQPLPLLKRHW